MRLRTQRDLKCIRLRTDAHVERYVSVLIRVLIIALFVPLLVAGAIRPAVGAQSTVSEDIDSRLAACPRFTIRLTEERIEAPATVVAGPMVLVQQQTQSGPGHAFVFRVPDDVSETALAKALHGGPAVEETPEWFWRADFVGNGDRAAADRPAIALVNLEPGRYVVGDPYRPAREYARFTALETPNRGTQLADRPNGDVEVDLFEMGFRLPASLAAGRSLWEVENTGAMLHEIAILPAPIGVTVAQVEAAVSAELEAELGGDIAAARVTIDALGEEWVGWSSRPVAGAGVLSPQRVSWAQIDLEAGTYAAVCYIPDPVTGTPHLMLGMSDVFTVEPTDA